MSWAQGEIPREYNANAVIPALCLQYLRIFNNLRKVLLGTLTFVIALTIAVVLVTIFECTPVAAAYDPSAYPVSRFYSVTMIYSQKDLHSKGFTVKRIHSQKDFLKWRSLCH